MGYYKAGKFWKDETLWKLCKRKFTVVSEIKDFLKQDCTWNLPDLEHLAMEIKAVDNANLDYPIIINKDNLILDGVHRVLRAHLEGRTFIKAYIINDDELPEPDYDEAKAVEQSKKE